MKKLVKLSIAFLLVVSVLTVFCGVVAGSASVVVASADAAVESAYEAIVLADSVGVDTGEFVVSLNLAINLTMQAKELVSTDLVAAEGLTDQARLLALNVTDHANLAAEVAVNTVPLVPIGVAVVCVVVGVVVFLFGPKVLWSVWFELRKDYKVVLSGVSKKCEPLFLTAEQLCALILALFLLVGFVSVSGFILPVNRGEQFSELGILGPNMQLGDYPSRVVAGETVLLYGYVGNHMSFPGYYTVLVKLGDNETKVDPAVASPVLECSQVVAHNESWVFPMSLTLVESGDNQRLIFELWMYNQSLNAVEYHGRWGQVWVNVTAPAS